MPILELSQLTEQQEAAAFLRGVVAGGRYANAYLFQGPAGVGKGTAALAFARALLCERAGSSAVATEAAGPSLFDAVATPAPATSVRTAEDDACGRCPACLKSRVLQHPDLKFLFPVSGEEKDLDTTIGETLNALRTDPLFV